MNEGMSSHTTEPGVEKVRLMQLTLPLRGVEESLARCIIDKTGLY